MARTNTEDFNVKMNYYATSKDLTEANGSYIDALKSAVNIFSNQVSNGLKTEEEINDFGEMLSVVKYFDKSIPGIEQVLEHYNNTMQNIDVMSYENTNAKMVA